MITFVLQENLYIRIGQTLAYILLSLWMGRRFRLLPNLILVAGVTLMHLLSPYGRILFSIGSWAITSGALVRGLYKGFLLVGLIYISRAFISPRLKLPGTAGRLLARTFAYFELITENRGDFNPRKPFVSLDGMLLKLSEELPREKTLPGETGTDGSGRAARAGILLWGGFNGFLLFLPLLIPGF